MKKMYFAIILGFSIIVVQTAYAEDGMNDPAEVNIEEDGGNEGTNDSVDVDIDFGGNEGTNDGSEDNETLGDGY